MRSASGVAFGPRGDDPSTEPLRAAMELLGQRWVLRVIWELEPGSLRFLELRRRMGNCSSSMLSERLQQLSVAGLVKKNEEPAWELTVMGAQLGAALTGVWDWAEHWARGVPRPPHQGASRP